MKNLGWIYLPRFLEKSYGNKNKNMQLQHVLNYNFLGNSVFSYLQSLNIFLAVWIVLFLFHKIVSRKIQDFAASSHHKLSDLGVVILNQLSSPLFVILALNIGILGLNLDLWFTRSIWIITVIVLLIYIIGAIKAVTDFSILNLESKADTVKDSQQKSLFYLISLLLQIVAWIIGAITLLRILQFDVTALVGTLGIGGIAIAFALQSILSDIFASFSIYLDQPFGVGDFIQIGADSGTVEKIGIKSTRIKTLQGEMMIIPNKELTGVRIQNFAHLERRRGHFQLKVELDTPNSKLKAVPKAVEQIIEFQTDCEFSRCNFIEIGSGSLIFEIVYFVDTSDYSAYLVARENINLEIKEYLEKNQIQLAYPAQEVIFKKSRI